MGRRLTVVRMLGVLAFAAAKRDVYLLDPGWKFELQNATYPNCSSPGTTFPIPLNNTQCLGLSQVTAASLSDCINACCMEPTCQTYQWCESTDCSPVNSCWIGAISQCEAAKGWISQGRNATAPVSPSKCTDSRCDPATNDSSWRVLDLPHDFVVEGTFTPTADKSHGYLPYGIGWYRRHFTVPSSAVGSTIWLDFDGVQTTSTVWLNGVLLGNHTSGYTASRYFLNASILNFGGDNLLAVKADATNPDGWWYDGGGIYRHVWITIVSTTGAYLAPWGVYTPAEVQGAIAWVGGAPFADSNVLPSVEVWNNASSVQAFSLTLTVFDPEGNTAGSTSGTGSVAAGGSVIWSPAQPIALANAALWHLVHVPLKPALYTAQTVLTIAGVAVDSVNVTFGVRDIRYDSATGFYLNGVATKILGNANHQDFAGLGVAIPDALQIHRISKLKEFGANGWRTAHNPPNPGLLDAADALGFLVWDENHRNGQDSEIPLLVKRDRNHPSVVIWSLCNEVLCETSNTVGDALRLKALIKTLDPLGGRPVSANYNPFIGNSTPLDVQGFDYSTTNYDAWHAASPQIPSISSETSSAVSDRGEYANDPVGGHVSGYDNNYPGWGEPAEGAWGGVAEPNNQGILTRPFISGGWTWTGWDYKGEPTPYAWPDINSHFGILDIAGFPKDRFYWYQAWFSQPAVPVLHLFPHWNWNTSTSTVDVWVYSNADEVELFVNGVSAGRKPSSTYAHVEWPAVTYTPGSLQAVAYINGSNTPAAVAFRNTTGAASALLITIKDGVGAQLVAGCADVALVQVQVVDSTGLVVPDASNNVTFTVTGPASLAGTGNGDPACHTPDKSAIRPAYHGYVLAVIQGGTTAGTVTVQASSPGLPTVSLQIPSALPPAGFSEYWCHLQPTL